jgi:hypothetical protein
MKRVFEIATLLLAVLAIGFAVKQYIDSRDLVTSNRKLDEKVEYLLGTASTRYVDEFPQDITGIDEVMSGTCEHLDIMVSIPGYGEYSNPKGFDRYKAALVAIAKSSLRENKQNKKCLGKKIDGTNDDANAHVRLLLFNPADRMAMLKEQFNQNTFLPDLQTNKNNTRQKFLDFFKENPRLIPGASPEAYLQKVSQGGFNGFLDLLDKGHRLTEEHYCNEGIEIRYSKERFSSYVWLQDRQEAAFTFGSGKRMTFRTRDASLIDVFRSVFDDAWSKSISFDDDRKQASGSH